MSWSTIIRLTCELVCTLFCVNCYIFTKYVEKEKYAGRLCSNNFIEYDFFGSFLQCLAMCSHKTTCGVTIYQRESKRCYNIRGEVQVKDCTTDLIGAIWYGKESRCPDTWKFSYKSCYKFTDRSMYRDDALALCKSYSENAHIADIKTMDQLEFLRINFLGPHIHLFGALWLGATDDFGDCDWSWSDGTEIELSDWSTTLCHGSGIRMCMKISTTTFQWIVGQCQGTKLIALCELDIY